MEAAETWEDRTVSTTDDKKNQDRASDKAPCISNISRHASSIFALDQSDIVRKCFVMEEQGAGSARNG